MIRWPALVVALGTITGGLSAQSYQVRLDTRGQMVRFQGLIADSVPASAVVTNASGGLVSADGFAVRCTGGAYCHYFRPGDIRRSAPITATATLSAWGFGVEGLALHATGRLVRDAGPDRSWPGTEPAAQLIEGYLEYRRPALAVRAGRQLVASRLEPVGFDGVTVRARWDRTNLEVAAYGGWGLAQAAAIPVLDPALNPLDEWRPDDRQQVAGVEATWTAPYADLRAEYRRELDPFDGSYVSERAALSLSARRGPLLVNGGLDYDIVDARVGSGDLSATLVHPRASVTVGARRYRPFFNLWTLWGAFSPVPYHAVHVASAWRPLSWLRLTARGERYRYTDAEVSTALVTGLQDRGWRASAGVTGEWSEHGSMRLGYALEHGPGAAGEYLDAALSIVPRPSLALDVYGGWLARPLELRFADATSRWIGGRLQWEFGSGRSVWTDITQVRDTRDRPDAAALHLGQLRTRAGLSLAFGTADRRWLPPARRSEP